MNSPTLSFVLPMWNEGEGAARAVGECLRVGEDLVARGFVTDFEVIAIDDGSIDMTAQEVMAVQDGRVRLISHDRNSGIGSAIRSGLSASSGDLVVYTDADLPAPLDEVDRLLERMTSTGVDIVAAYRRRGRGDGLKRTLVSWVWNRLVRLALGLRIRDVNFAFKLFDGPRVRALPLKSAGVGIDAEILARAREAGASMAQVGVDYQPRRTGVSTLSTLRVAFQTLRELVRVRRSLGRRSGLRARQVVRAYDGMNRVHVAIRLSICPFDDIERLLPKRGTLIDYGCGHGHFALLAASRCPARRLLAVDIDDRKVKAFVRGANRFWTVRERIEIVTVPVGWTPDVVVDSIVMIDALYLLDGLAREQIVRTAAEHLSPGGVMLIKEMDMRKRWKGIVTRASYLVMSRLLRITSTSSSRQTYPTPDEIARWLRAAGLDVESIPFDRGYPFPHHVVIGRRPDGGVLGPSPAR